MEVRDPFFLPPFSLAVTDPAPGETATFYKVKIANP